MMGSRARARIWAAASTASAVVAGLPSIRAGGLSSMVCSANQARPRVQAFLALVMRLASRSTVRSMSSQTQPQKVQVACSTTRMF